MTYLFSGTWYSSEKNNQTQDKRMNMWQQWQVLSLKIKHKGANSRDQIPGEGCFTAGRRPLWVKTYRVPKSKSTVPFSLQAKQTKCPKLRLCFQFDNSQLPSHISPVKPAAHEAPRFPENVASFSTSPCLNFPTGPTIPSLRYDRHKSTLLIECENSSGTL